MASVVEFKVQLALDFEEVDSTFPFSRKASFATLPDAVAWKVTFPETELELAEVEIATLGPTLPTAPAVKSSKYSEPA